jgi:hypothetical protein
MWMLVVWVVVANAGLGLDVVVEDPGLGLLKAAVVVANPGLGLVELVASW